MPEILMPQPYVSPWMQDEVADVLTLARTFFEREVTPHAERFAEQHQVDKETWLAAGAAGLLCISIPEEYLSLIHISEPTRRHHVSRMPSSA